ncbi:MAG: hypothetical protein KBB55_00070 [Candidatus Buchananbacteria bacterium]|nr:hypothetical protein [Candidatus Buchananbacteria bacterium]
MSSKKKIVKVTLGPLTLGPLTRSLNNVRGAQQVLEKHTSQARRLWLWRQDGIQKGGTTGQPAMDWLLRAFQTQDVQQLVRCDAIGVLDALGKVIDKHQGELIAVATILTTRYDDQGARFDWGYNAACGRICGPLQFPTPDGFSARLAVPVTSLYSDHRGIDQEIAGYNRGKSGDIHLSSQLLLGEGDWTAGRQYHDAYIAIIGQTAIQHWARQNHGENYLNEVAENFADWADDSN